MRMMIDSITHQVRATTHTRNLIKCMRMDEILRAVPITLAFFYDRIINPADLKAALSEGLTHHPAFAGRLKRTKEWFGIDCDNQGATLTIQRYGCSIDEALQGLFDPIMGSSLYRVINPATVISEQEPLLHVQANTFSDSKMCLTIVWHHSIGDMQTLMMFMTTWSNALAGLQQTASPLWVEDRAAYLETMLEDRGTETPIVRWMDDQELAEFVAFMETKATDQKRVHFYFTSTELRRMREEFRQRTGCLLSTNDALCAHMWSLIDGCDRRDHDRTLAIAVNFRPRVGLPSSLAGNMISNVAFPCAPGRCANDVAREIRYLINNFATLQMDHFATESYIAARGQRADRPFPAQRPGSSKGLHRDHDMDQIWPLSSEFRRRTAVLCKPTRLHSLSAAVQYLRGF